MLCPRSRSHHHGCRAVIHCGSVAGSDCAVFLENRFQIAQRRSAAVFARAFILLKQHRGFAFFLCRQFHRDNLALEAAFLPCLYGLLVRAHGIFVLLLACNAIFLRDVLARHAHVVVVVNVPEAVIHDGIDDLRIPEPIAFTRLREQIRCVCHGFHSACHNNLSVAGLDGLGRQRHGFQSRTTNLVDGHCPDSIIQSTTQRRLARGILSQRPELALEITAEDDLFAQTGANTQQHKEPGFKIGVGRECTEHADGVLLLLFQIV